MQHYCHVTTHTTSSAILEAIHVLLQINTFAVVKKVRATVGTVQGESRFEEKLRKK